MRSLHRSVLVVLAALTAAACGTRVNGPGAALPAAGTQASASASSIGAVGGSGEGAPSPTALSEAPAGAVTSGGGSTMPAGAGAGAGAAVRDKPVASKTPGASAPAAPANQPGGASPAALPATPGRPPGPGAPETANRADPHAPLVIASTGTYTGPIGSILFPGTQAVQVWVSATNDRGGINGHPVRLIVYDDGGDPARNRAQVQDAIERQKVIAFVHNAAPFLTKGTQEYVTSKRVPVIGTETGTELVYQSPMYFPQATSGYANIRSALLTAARQMLPVGKKRLATLTCVEAQQCADADRLWADMAGGLGFQLVNRGRSSITQPDYSAECLTARNAGAEVVVLAMEATATERLALSCARQGYHPTFGTLASIAADRQKDDPALDGMMTSSNVFPYVASGTAPIDEFHAAMKRYGTKVPPGVGAAIGWVAAKLFERAASGIGESPTSDQILSGLWSLRDDTLGGLTSPLTFRADQLPPVVTCWYDLAIKDGKWIVVGDGHLNCQ